MRAAATKILQTATANHFLIINNSIIILTTHSQMKKSLIKEDLYF